MDSSSYIGTYNIIFGILYRNILLVTKRIYKNFKNILNNKEKYEMSKSKLTESLREVEKILNGK